MTREKKPNYQNSTNFVFGIPIPFLILLQCVFEIENDFLERYRVFITQGVSVK